MNSVPEIFGINAFDDAAMQSALPKETYKSLKRTMQDGRGLDLSVANVVATAMKEWACAKGATHFTHWFQPMTGITAEKHDSFISPAQDGRVIMEFSGKELVKGEPDASSFPSGGLRATFEARGYTAWDPTSFAFVKDKTLYIPTAFCSYGGDALDKKTPLLRSMEALNRQALRILRLFGKDDVKIVKTTVGPEQEYFLISKETFEKRRDLIITGRTLFGARPPKGQELDDHYFGSIKPKIAHFMQEVDTELWKLGILSKTKHNETAPGQHELAPMFSTTNIATDHNQLIMETLKNVAAKENLVCLLHEKPFAGVNGSGKHNNWSLSTSTGINLLEPGDTPAEDAQFLLFLLAVIKAVDDYQDLLRISIASAGNDHRLGAHEAPPAIVSIFLGEELTEIFEALEKDAPYGGKEKVQLKIGVHVLPPFPKDTTDRNRTSPFAFTGNRFEFRMLGSSASVADPNTALNTAVAESLRQFADELEGAKDFDAKLHSLIQRTIKNHKRIIFNGNGYDNSWIKEAKARGLSNFKTTPDCLPRFIDEKNISLFTSHKVLSEAEVRSRHDMMLENYIKRIKIEALTMLGMAKQELIPAISAYSKSLCDTICAKNAISSLTLACDFEKSTLQRLEDLTSTAFIKCGELETALEKLPETGTRTEESFFVKDKILPLMLELRGAIDDAETITAKSFWQVPTYEDILFSVK